MLGEALRRLPWTVAGCGNTDHDASWSCHMVKDSDGDTLLHSVTREVAEAFAGIPPLAAERDALRERVAALEKEHEEDQGVICVWRGRAERAEAAIAAARIIADGTP